MREQRGLLAKDLFSLLLQGLLAILVASIAPPLLGSQGTNDSRQGTATRREAEAARTTILAIHEKLPDTVFHDNYSVTVDLETGAIALDNTQVRWESNLSDLDASNITIEQYTPAGKGISPVSLISPRCLGGKRCVKWGYKAHSDFSALKPSEDKVQFYVYQGRSGGRDLDVEKQMVEALQTLIIYSQQRRQ